MGGDGGSIPQRVDLVKMKNKRLKDGGGSLGYEKNTMVIKSFNKSNKKELKEFYFNHCVLSEEILKIPFFCCRLGFLYNKEEALKLILLKRHNKKKRKRTQDDKFAHIESLKDLVICKNKLNEEGKLVCLLSNEIITSTTGGICIFTCGCVYSKKVFNKVNVNQDQVCINCNKKYKSSDIIEIGMDEDLLMEKKNHILREKRKLEKIKEKKRKEEKQESKKKTIKT